MTTRNSRLRVYLVEDSSIMTDLLTGLLTSQGMRVIGYAVDTTTAVSEIIELRPDVVILDIALRDGNGFDVLKATRSSDREEPTFVVLTNYSVEPYRKAAQRLGVEHFFDKSTGILRMVELVKGLAQNQEKNNGSTG